jgi:hypothetical protein
MLIRNPFSIIAIPGLLLLSAAFAHAQNVNGSGTAGTVPRWTGSTTLADSSIKADSNGQVAIGATPSIFARLYVLSSLGIGVKGEHTGIGTGILGLTVSGIGARGESSGSGRGVYGVSVSGIGVSGSSTSSYGVSASSSSSDGLNATSSSSDPARAAVRATGNNGAFAGIFQGDVSVSGMLSKGGGSFKIDHPLDPENKYLSHSFVESPDMMNLYNGNITTDENGEAIVVLPEYFEALNKEFRYQLTVIDTFAQAIIAEKVKGNRFKIKTSAAGVEVSWQVTGIRQDGWAIKNRIRVEEEKSERERGFYLHPEAYNQPEERGVEWARNPAMMKELKDAKRQSQR